MYPERKGWWVQVANSQNKNQNMTYRTKREQIYGQTTYTYHF